MKKHTPRISRELKTIQAMIALYCRDVHHTRGSGVCSECAGLLTYAEGRIEGCPYDADKPTCAKCPIHCYPPKRRGQIKAVMRHAGPRMMYHHPLLAARHWLDGMKKVPCRANGKDGTKQVPKVHSEQKGGSL